jgi:Mrp family chromosome partitioning ATPase
MLALLKDLRRRFDHVIIDTPPVLDLADAGILGAWSDEVLLVARMNVTPQPLVMQAMRTLGSYNAPVTGLIATDHQRPSRHYSRHGYYRYYRQSRAEAA